MAGIIRRFDPVLILGLSVAAATCWHYLAFGQAPREDAAILLRYSVNIADGLGIVWNRGGPPSDGGSDFVAMLAVALLIKAGIEPMMAVQMLGALFHILTAAVIFHALRKLEGASVVVAGTAAIYFAAGPGLCLIVAGFATPIFGFAAALTWYFALDLILAENPGSGLAFAMSGSALGLVRFEGSILAILVLAAILTARRDMRGVRIAAIAVFVFTILWGGFFCWHWIHFGHPFPLPYYRLGGGRLHPSSLGRSIAATLALGGPFWLAFLSGIANPATRRLTAAFLIPVVVYTLAWVFVSSAANYGMRFQYPLLPVVLMSWYPLVKGMAWDAWIRHPGQRSSPRATLARVVTCVVVVLYSVQLDIGGEWFRNSNIDVARVLSRFDHNYVLATKEAGVVPLYSGWRTIDTWGLNDPWIAHHHGIDERYLDSARPEVILVEGPFDAINDDYAMDEQNDEWKQMVATLKCYARRNRYVVAAAFGASRLSTMTYYVRPGKDGDSIVKSIRAVPFNDVESSGAWPAVNFATLHDSGDERSPTADAIGDRSVRCDPRPVPPDPQ